MKKITFPCVLAVLAIFLILTAKIEPANATYTETALAYHVTETTATLMDNNGNLWKLEDVSISLGDVVRITIDNSGTPSVEDDTIIDFEIMPR